MCQTSPDLRHKQVGWLRTAIPDLYASTSLAALRVLFVWNETVGVVHEEPRRLEKADYVDAAGLGPVCAKASDLCGQ